VTAPLPPSDAQVVAWRSAFPALLLRPHGQRLAYLDSASTSLKPQAVIDAVVGSFTREAGNVHRGLHALSEAATALYEGARAEVAQLLGPGARTDEVVFTSGTTDAINLVAQAWGRAHVGPGDAVLVTGLEHHSNLVPWQLLCKERGAELRVAPIDEGGRIDLAGIEQLLDRRVKLVAVCHLSNVVGTIAPLHSIAERAHAVGALLLVDGAQAIAHLDVDVGRLGCDFYAFSGHKLLGPTGTGVLWGRGALLEAMPPWKGGGEMVATVDDASATFQPPPLRFEAGTPDIAGVIGLGAALRHLRSLERAAALAHESALHALLYARLAAIAGVRVLGAPEAAVVSFTLAGVHAHDLAAFVDREGVAIRSGLHCAEPLHRRLGAAASARASLAYYNNAADVEQLALAVERAREALA
jgi:cysteine desulfurase / selenocysteine lyase